jgi:hypothetical protein
MSLMMRAVEQVFLQRQIDRVPNVYLSSWLGRLVHYSEGGIRGGAQAWGQDSNSSKA